MKYVPGEPHMPRHLVEVCCEPLDDSSVGGRHLVPMDDDEDHAQCLPCSDCDFPQKVNDVCCKIALGLDYDARYGSYEPHCEDDEVCCKCGPGPDDYECIPKHPGICDLCVTTTTTEGTDPTTTTAQITEPTTTTTDATARYVT